MKKLLFILLALPMFAAAQAVQVPNSCDAGNAFTIRIPVRFPDSMTVKYMWYRNDTAVTAEATLLPNEKTIAYTVPANEAYGDNVAFHFKYHLDDGYDEWTASRKYVITFVVPCQPPTISAITGSIEVCANTAGLTYSVTNVTGTAYTWTLPVGWTQTAGGTTNSITVAAGTSATSGSISVTPFKDCAGETRTLAVTVNALPTAPTTVNYSCNSNQTATFTASGSTGGSGALSYLWSTVTTPNSGTWNALTTTKTLTTTSTNHYMIAQDSKGCRSAVSSALAARLPSAPTTVNYSCNYNQTATFTASGSSGGNGTTSYLWSTVTTPTSGTWNALTTTKTLTTTSTNHYLLAQDSKTCRSAVSSAVAASLPAQPSAISGPSSVCPDYEYTYSITDVGGDISYEWGFPLGWDWADYGHGNNESWEAYAGLYATPNATSGNVSVRPYNYTTGCWGPTRTLAVTVKPRPTPPTITGPYINEGISEGIYKPTVCAGTTGLYFYVGGGGSGLTLSYSLSGTGWTKTSVGNSLPMWATAGTANGQIWATVVNTTTNCSSSSNLTIPVVPVPAQPAGIEGTTIACRDCEHEYWVEASSPSLTYEWTWPSGWDCTNCWGSANHFIAQPYSGEYYLGDRVGNIGVKACNAGCCGPVRTLQVLTTTGVCGPCK